MEKKKNKYSVKEVKGLISEELQKQIRVKKLMEQKQIIENQLNILLKEYVQAPPSTEMSNSYVNNTGNYVSSDNKKSDKVESIFDTRPNETIILNFQDVNIKIQRQLDDMFKVVDASESKKVKNGDYIKVQGNDILQQGRAFKFVIYRDAGVVYQSNPLQSWKIIKNR